MNNLVGFEIQSDNPEKAAAFYGAVFGWNFVRDDFIPIEYWRLQSIDGLQGAILKRPVEMPPSHSGTNAFVCSFMVANFDATATTITAQGGTVAMEKFAVPGKCWQGYFIDLDGNTFGVIEVDESL